MSMGTNYSANVLASLSEAAYANLTIARNNDSLVPIALERGGLPEKLATNVSATYELSDHTANDSTGFSATLLQRRSDPNQYVLAIRGTDDLVDIFVADLQFVVGKGYARSQLVSLYNYVQRLTAPLNELCLQVREVFTRDAPSGRDSFYDSRSRLYISYTSSMSGVGLGALTGSYQLSVTGHSLGGHLALGFSRLFPSLYSDIVTFNAPGYGADAQIAEFFRVIGAATQFPVSGTRNFDGSAGISPIANVLGREKPNGREIVFVEDQLSIAYPQVALNHSQALLTDSLALYSVFARVDENLTIDAVTRLLTESSLDRSASLETSLDGLRRLYRAPQASINTPIANRQTYFSRLYELEKMFTDGVASSGQVLLLSGMDAATLASNAMAADGVAYRYALKELNPYVVVGTSSFYATHVAAGGLNFNDATGGGMGGLSARWIESRASLLKVMEYRNARELKGVVDYPNADRPVDYVFADREGRQERIRVRASGIPFGGVGSTQQIAFGTENSDRLAGSSESDSLFGEAGNDRLTGLAGTDYIEGGAGNDEVNGGLGNDVLIGGEGFDTYIYKNGDGQDRIIDSDRQGRVLVDSVKGPVALGLWVADGSTPNKWTTANGAAILTHNSPWTVTFSDGGSIVLGDMLEADDFSFTLNTADDFADGYATVTYLDEEIAMAIEDDAGRQAALLARQSGIAGDTHYLGGPDADFWDDLAGSNLVELGDGDDFARLGAEDDIVAGGDGTDAILGGAGDDHLFATDLASLDEVFSSEAEASGEPGDTLADIAGDDWLIGGAGDDVISGGDGSDLLVGAAGEDHIYGDDYFPMAVADSDGNPVSWSFDPDIERQHTPHGEIMEAIYRDTGDGGNDEIHGGSGNDWINAGSGDDVVYGDAGDDYLLGGSGSDAVFGGDGDDWLIADGIADFSPRDEPDYLDGGDGNDLIVGNEGDNVIFGGAGDDEILAGGGNNIIDGGEGNDTITADSGEESAAWVSIVHGGAGDDDISASGELYGDEGNDMISGAAPGDELYGGAGNDLLISGGADSRFDGGEGDDVYSLGLEAGRSTISDAAGNDTIELASFDLSDDPDHETIADSSLRLTVENDRFVLHYGELGDSVEFLDDSITVERVRIVHEFEPGDVRISEILLSSLPVEGAGTADGDVITAGSASAISVHAGDGDDIAYGTAGGDEFYGEGGDDVLIGGAGADTYHFARDAGQDRIVDVGGGAVEADRIVLEGIRPADVSVFSTDGFLLLRVADNGGEIIVDWDATADTGVEQVAFDDATEWNRDQLLAQAQPLEFAVPEVLDLEVAVDGGAGSGVAVADPGVAGTEPVLLFGDASDAFGSGGFAGLPGATGTRSTAAARGSSATDSGAASADSVSIAAAPLPIEAFFNRVTPPPMPVQQWLDNWMPSGSRAASGSSESGTERVAVPPGDAPAADSLAPASSSQPSSQPSSPAPGTDDAALTDLPTEEIARRYARIDAWLAEDENDDPHDRIGAGAAIYSYGMPGDGSGVMPADSGASLRIASGGFVNLAPAALRPLRGLDEGFARLG